MSRRVVYLREPSSVGWGAEVIPPKVPTRGSATPYREQKIAAHTTRGGRGRVARVTRPAKGKA